MWLFGGDSAIPPTSAGFSSRPTVSPPAACFIGSQPPPVRYGSPACGGGRNSPRALDDPIIHVARRPVALLTSCDLDNSLRPQLPLGVSQSGTAAGHGRSRTRVWWRACRDCRFSECC